MWLMLFLLAGCSTTGRLHHGEMVNYSKIKCETVEPYYLMFDIETDLSNMRQQGIVSWQCGDSDRRYIYLEEYELSMGDR